ncbi:radical SAM protein [bacterium]|nr:radical SAM protein [bacterium]
MKTCLIFPPSSDPTAPYISLPSLAAYLRAHDIPVLCIDANIEAYERLLTKDSLIKSGSRLKGRFSRLDRKKALGHYDRIIYAHLCREIGLVRSVPFAIEDAISILKDRSGREFYDTRRYNMAIETVEAALRIISAAYSPLRLNFSNCFTPFSFLTAEDIRMDAQPQINPFYEYFSDTLMHRLKAEKVDLVGISIVFPGQLQPSYSLGYLLRRALPDVHITAGGPAISQLLVRINQSEISSALGPFHSAIIFEGEKALIDLIRRKEKGESVSGVFRGDTIQDMSALPAPDFEGMPMEKYLSPEVVLPYDATRGCYWGKCAFCHYGLSEYGAAKYRERPVEQIACHLGILSEKYGTGIFYFSDDTMAPHLAVRIAGEIKGKRLNIRWATDMRPERSLTQENCMKMAEGGALCLTLGIESASERILRLMDKGVHLHDMKDIIVNIADADIAVEVMCFTGFPTEKHDEAMKTIQFIKGLSEYISLFICGEFELTHGSRVAVSPHEFGIKEIWHVDGDRFRTGIFYEEKEYTKSFKEKEREDHAIAMLSRRWQLRRYPWAGSLSTAHTFLWYDRFGPGAFKTPIKLTETLHIHNTHPFKNIGRGPNRSHFNVEKIFNETEEREKGIWETMIRKERRVSRRLYMALARKHPLLFPMSAIKI